MNETIVDFGDVSSILSIVLIAFIVCDTVGLVHRAGTIRLTGKFVLLLVMCTLIGLFNVRTDGCVLSLIFGGLLLILIVVFAPRVHRTLRDINEDSISGFGFFKFHSNTRRGQHRRVRGVIGTMYHTDSSVDSGRVNTLVIFRRRAVLNSVVSSNAIVSTGISPRVVNGVFCPNTPLRSKTTIFHSNEVYTTNYVLPLAPGRSVDDRLKAHRETSVNVDRRDSTIVIIMSRRAKTVSITCGNELHENVSSNSLQRVLVRRFIGPRRSRKGSGVGG